MRAAGRNIRRIRFDRGEARSTTMQSWLTEIGARPEWTSAHSSQSNGVAERSHQTTTALAKTMMFAGHFPKAAWAELMQTAKVINNRLPASANPNCKSPYEMKHHRVPSLHFMRTIGCKAFVHIHGADRRALDPQAREGKLIGYGIQSRCYRVLLPNNQVIESAHVTFDETNGTHPLITKVAGVGGDFTTTATITNNRFDALQHNDNDDGENNNFIYTQNSVVRYGWLICVSGITTTTIYIAIPATRNVLNRFVNTVI